MKKEEKKIILTFDYELSLGTDSGTVQNCIITPTDEILKLLKAYNAKAVFFVDAVFLMVLKKDGHKDLDLISEQLNNIIRQGSDIGLHIHPQWLDAYKKDEKRWSFYNFDHYRIHSITKSEAVKLFNESKKNLIDLLDKELRHYRINSFRAGGWAIQPFEFLKDIFIKNNLKYDFSVNPGLFSGDNSFSFYDFRNARTDLDYWCFNNDPCSVYDKGIFWEIPVTTVKVRKVELWLSYYFIRKNEKEYGDGKSIKSRTDNDITTNLLSKFKNFFNLLNTVTSSISVDGLAAPFFKKFLRKAVKQHLLLTFVAHPKKLSKSGVINIKYLLKNFKTIGISDITEIINN